MFLSTNYTHDLRLILNASTSYQEDMYDWLGYKSKLERNTISDKHKGYD